MIITDFIRSGLSSRVTALVLEFTSIVPLILVLYNSLLCKSQPGVDRHQSQLAAFLGSFEGIRLPEVVCRFFDEL
jgi:hypothetical protein